MKRTLFAVCIGTLVLAMGAAGQDNQKANQGRGKGRAAVKAQTTASGGVRRGGQVATRQNVKAQQFHQRQNINAQNTSSTRVSGSNRHFNRTQTAKARSIRTAERRQADVAVQNNRAQVRANRNIQRERNFNRGDRNFVVNRERNINRTRNVTVVNNWRGDRFAGRSYAAFRNYHRAWHDRFWWTSHYNRIIFVSGGWWFWNAGYWYPAWGYNPGYVYPYDGPIYGYGDLSPDQIVVNVQLQLQRDGYYAGPVDGVLGSQTRQAIAAFQADHGLAITSAIDEPTLNRMGLA